MNTIEGGLCTHTIQFKLETQKYTVTKIQKFDLFYLICEKACMCQMERKIQKEIDNNQKRQSAKKYS